MIRSTFSRKVKKIIEYTTLSIKNLYFSRLGSLRTLQTLYPKATWWENAGAEFSEIYKNSEGCEEGDLVGKSLIFFYLFKIVPLFSCI